MEATTLIPIAQAAEQLGITQVAVRNAILRGRFSAVKLGRTWYTTKEAIEAYRPRTSGKKVETLTEIKPDLLALSGAIRYTHAK